MESFSGYDPDDVIQKYFTGSDQLTLTDTKLEEALRNGSSTNVDSAREDILAKLRVSMMKTTAIELCLQTVTKQDQSTLWSLSARKMLIALSNASALLSNTSAMFISNAKQY